MNNTPPSDGAHLAQLRRAHNVPQWVLAQRLDRTQAWLSCIERGQRVVPATTLKVIAEALTAIVAERQKERT